MLPNIFVVVIEYDRLDVHYRTYASRNYDTLAEAEENLEMVRTIWEDGDRENLSLEILKYAPVPF